MIGVDEVGRGAWAGPLLVCAVRLNSPIEGLKDSKKLTAKKRQELTVQIKAAAADIGFGWVTPKEIDNYGLSAALKTATANAITEIDPKIDEEIIIDGNVNFAPQYSNSKTVISADDLYPAVSAASIVAKVARDAYMAELASKLPNYGFEKHVGYGTSLHTTSIKKYGLSHAHRHSFRLPA